jgi:hypoxanthine phosphoribosyltransferase
LKLDLRYGKDEIQVRVADLSMWIDNDYKDTKEDLVLVGVLKGAFILLADLSRLIKREHSIDFIAVGSYGLNGSDQGEVKLLLDTRQNLRGKNILIVEDIIDSGETMKFLMKIFKDKGANSIKICSLLRRENSKSKDIIDYCGFVVPTDKWLVGYGLDSSEKYRTLDQIYSIEKEN